MSEQVFTIAATWDPAVKRGTLATADGSLKTAHAGAASLGGGNGAPNPEELLLAAVSACFVQTWAIFLAKLQVPIEAPALDGSCELDKDPAGGFRLTKVDLAPRVPAALWESRRADVEEKYCIVSKAVKGSLALTVTPKPV
jgi:organic hydroperoxide reductase OsmC/OhrA